MNQLAQPTIAARALAIAKAQFGPAIAVSCAPVKDHAHVLFPQEARAVSDAIPARRDEFSTGRVLARRAMDMLGHPPAAIAMQADRSPGWPNGLTGSLSHGAGLCIAALGRRAEVLAIGVDVEDAAQLPDDLLEFICTPAELDWLCRFAPDQQKLVAQAVFSAKEAAYKCQFTLTDTVLEFQDVELSMSLETGDFVARFVRAAASFPAGDAIRGHVAITPDFILSSAAIFPSSVTS